MQQFLEDFLTGLRQTGWLEAIAVIAGIVSVWFSRLENIWVYPTGLVSTIIYVYLSFTGHLLGEVAVNVFYTIMSIYGWVLWAKKDESGERPELNITRSNRREWILQLGFFSALFMIFFFCLRLLKEGFASGALPVPDAFASASAFTGMLLMARKKTESWMWWIITNIVSIPLYYVKGYALTSVLFLVLLLMAIAGWISWEKKYRVENA